MRKIITTLLLIGMSWSMYGQKPDTPTDTTKKYSPMSTLTAADERAAKFLPQYAPLSPNAWAFQKMGDYQVNLATGIPSIPLVLHTIQAGGLTVPLTMSFHTGGFKLNEQASWVGFGASLDIGASINRTVQGRNDDVVGGNYVDNPISASKDFCYSTTDYSYGQQVQLNQIDTEPDIFSYSLQGKSGKYILGQNGLDYFKIPNYPIQISHSGTPISSISIIDDNGTKYVFSQGESQTVVSGSSTQSYISSWGISQIQSANSDDALTYSYQSGGGQYLSERQWVASMLYNAVPQSGGHYENSVSMIPHYTTVSTSISQVNPYKISYKNGEIEFIQSNAGERLDLINSRYLKQINVYNYEYGAKKLIKVIKFTYSYFSGIRLKLDKISISDELNSSTEEYVFDYWSNTLSWNENTDNEKKDYWGYYNGKPNTHLIPVSSYNGISMNGGAADRSTVATYMKEGVLKRITYPHKGYSEFDYEVNRYHDGVSEQYAGGLRVKSMVSNSGGNTVMKRYEYSSSAGTGVGRLTTNWNPSSTSVPVLQDLLYDDQNGNNQSYGTATQASFTQSGGAIELNTMDAAPVYYTSVTEYFEDSSDPVKNGKNVYEFDFRQDAIVNTINYVSRDVQPWKRGNLVSKTTYDKDNVLVSVQNNQYQEYASDTRLAAGFVSAPKVYEGFTASQNPCPTGYMPNFPTMAYHTVNYQTGINLINSSTNVVDNVSVSQNTSYNSKLLVSQTQDTDSRSGESKTESFIYPFDGSYSSDAVAQSMVSRNMLNTPLETSVSETISGNTQTLYQEKRVYDIFTGSNARGLSNNRHLSN